MLDSRSSTKATDVAVFLPDLRGGGVEKVRVMLAREFVRRGVRTSFVLLEARGPWLENLPDDVQVVSLHAGRVRSAFLPLVRYLQQERPRALLAAMWPLTTLAIAAAKCSGASTRVVVSDHSDVLAPGYGMGSKERHLRRLTMPLSYRASDAVVAVSDGVARTVSNLANIPKQRISIIHNPVGEAPTIRPVNDHATDGWSEHSGPRLISVGNLKPAKDYPTLLRALSVIRKSVDARLLILGEGFLRENLVRLAGQLGVGDAVFMPGFRENAADYIALSDVFILSSAWEGFGNVLVEALACGVNVVSCDCPSGPAEILEGGRWGRLVPVGNPQAMSLAIREALRHPLPEEMLRGRALDFSVPQAADRYLALLNAE